MTEAEIKLRKELDRALLNGRDDVDALISLLKEGEYFIHHGKILNLVEVNWDDWEDQCEAWTIWTEMREDED